MRRQNSSKGGEGGVTDERLERQALLLFLLLEDCMGLLPGWMHVLHDDVSVSADVAQVKH